MSDGVVKYVSADLTVNGMSSADFSVSTRLIFKHSIVRYLGYESNPDLVQIVSITDVESNRRKLLQTRTAIVNMKILFSNEGEEVSIVEAFDNTTSLTAAVQSEVPNVMNMTSETAINYVVVQDPPSAAGENLRQYAGAVLAALAFIFIVIPGVYWYYALAYPTGSLAKVTRILIGKSAYDTIRNSVCLYSCGREDPYDMNYNHKLLQMHLGTKYRNPLVPTPPDGRAVVLRI